MATKELAFTATFVDERGYVMGLFWNRYTGEWVITGYHDADACIITSGFGFWPAMERES